MVELCSVLVRHIEPVYSQLQFQCLVLQIVVERNAVVVEKVAMIVGSDIV